MKKSTMLFPSSLLLFSLLLSISYAAPFITDFSLWSGAVGNDGNPVFFGKANSNTSTIFIACTSSDCSSKTATLGYAAASATANGAAVVTAGNNPYTVLCQQNSPQLVFGECADSTCTSYTAAPRTVDFTPIAGCSVNTIPGTTDFLIVGVNSQTISNYVDIIRCLNPSCDSNTTNHIVTPYNLYQGTGCNKPKVHFHSQGTNMTLQFVSTSSPVVVFMLCSDYNCTDVFYTTVPDTASQGYTSGTVVGFDPFNAPTTFIKDSSSIVQVCSSPECSSIETQNFFGFGTGVLFSGPLSVQFGSTLVFYWVNPELATLARSSCVLPGCLSATFQKTTYTVPSSQASACGLLYRDSAGVETLIYNENMATTHIQSSPTSTCPDGKGYDIISNICTDCPANWYANSSRTTNDCTACPTGSVSSPGSDSCTYCSPGYFSLGENCQLCPNGHYSTISGQFYNSSSFPCSPCPAGRFSTNGVNCSSCPAGKYSGIGASSCITCPSGTETTTSGMSSCTKAPEKETTAKSALSGEASDESIIYTLAAVAVLLFIGTIALVVFTRKSLTRQSPIEFA